MPTLTSYVDSTIQPTSIADLALWLDAADASTFSFSSGSNISQWRDKSSSGINMAYNTGTVVYNTTGFNNSPTITFGPLRSGLKFNSSLNLSATASLSFYIVFRHTVSSGNGRLISFYSDPTSLDYNNPGFCLFFNLTANISFARGGPYTAANNTTISNINVFTSVIFNGNSTGTYAIPSLNTGISVNGGTFTNYTGYSIGTPFGSTYNPIGIGIATPEIGPIFNGNISEIIMYKRALNATENSQVEGYLAWKWNLASSLPANHPYKNAPYGTNYGSGMKVYTESTIQPTSIAGLALWLDAADASTVVLSGSNVTTWKDKSANALLLSNTTTGNQPTYSQNSINGLPSLVFNGTSQYLVKTAISYSLVLTNSECTIFFIHKAPSSVSANELSPISWMNLGINSGVPRVSFHDPGGNTFTMDFYTYNAGGRLSVAQNYTTNNVRMDCGFKRGTGQYLRSYGSQIGTQTNTNTITSGSYPLCVGGLFNGITGSYLYQGNICEIVWYNRALLDSEIYQIEGYLAWKWNLAASLPANHAYKNAPYGTNYGSGMKSTPF